MTTTDFDREIAGKEIAFQDLRFPPQSVANPQSVQYFASDFPYHPCPSCGCGYYGTHLAQAGEMTCAHCRSKCQKQPWPGETCDVIDPRIGRFEWDRIVARIDWIEAHS